MLGALLAKRWTERPDLVNVPQLSDIALIGAACHSPFAVHRLPVLESAFVAALAAEQPLTGGEPQDLPAVLARAAAVDPMAHAIEGWWASDPRTVVSSSYAGQRWRLHPGWIRRPADNVDTALDVAYALDAAVEATLGFRASDLIELSLRYMDAAVLHFAGSWPTGPRHGPDRQRLRHDPAGFSAATIAIPAQVTHVEVAAARRWWSSDRLGNAAAQCSHPERAQRAVSWATMSGEDFTGEELHAHLAVRVGARRWACPASLVLARLDEMLSRLDEEAGDSRSRHRLVGRTVVKLNRLLHDNLSTTFVEGALAGLDAASDATPSGAAEPSGGDIASPAGQPVEDSARATRQATQEELLPAWSPGDPHTLMQAGNRLFSFVVVPALTLTTAVEVIQNSYTQLSGLTADELFKRLRRPGTVGSVHVPVVLTHGPIEVLVAHGMGTAVIDMPTFRQMLRDADGRAGGRDLVWQYLEDLAFPDDDIEEILPAAADDLWDHWLTYGGFVPYPSRSDESVVVLVGPTLWDPTWEWSGRLEAVVDLASRAGLPDPSAMPSLDLESDSRATVWSLQAQFSMAFAAPRIVVGGPTDQSSVPDHTYPSTIIGLVVGLRNALADSGLGDAMANAEGIYRLQVLVIDNTEPGKEEAAHLSGSDLNGYEIVVPVAVVRHFVDYPRETHSSFGRILAAPHGERPAVADALRRWDELPTLLDLDSSWHIADPPPPHLWMEPDIASKNRAERAVRARISNQEMPVEGVSNGAAAVDWVRRIALPAVLDELDSRLDTYSPDLLLDAAVRAMDAAHAERARRRRVTQLGLASRQRDSVRTHTLTEPDSAILTRPAEILLDHIVRRHDRPVGVGRPDRFDVAELTNLAGIALEYATGADLAVRGVGGLSVAVDAGGFAVVVTPNRAGVHLDDDAMDQDADQRAGDGSGDPDDDGQGAAASNGGAEGSGAAEPGAATDLIEPAEDMAVSPSRWLEAVRIHNLDNASAPEFAEPGNADSGAGWRSVMSNDQIPSRMRALNNVMIDELGWGIDAVFAALSAAASLRPDFVPRTPTAEFTADVAAWSGLDVDQVGAAVRFLTHRPEPTEDPHQFYEQERRTQRTFLRPFVPVSDDQLLIPRHLARALQEVAADMLGEGRLVWSSLPTAVIDTANELRSWLTRHFERQIEMAVDAAGLPYRANLEPHEAAEAGAPGLDGEIDVLACDQAAGRLWVVETKEHIDSASPYSITQRARRFLRRKRGYIPKTLAKAQTVRDHADAFAAIACKEPVAAPPGGWTVVPVMVTNRIEPAAFPQDRESAVPFVLGQDFTEHLSTLDRNYDRRA